MKEFYNNIDKINWACKRLNISKGDSVVSLNFNKKEAFRPEDIYRDFINICTNNNIDIKYIFIAENNTLFNKKWKREYKLDKYHAHILIRNIADEDIKKIKNQWILINNKNSFDIRNIYDLDNLIKYLSKQLNTDNCHIIQQAYMQTNLKERVLTPLKRDVEEIKKSPSKINIIRNTFLIRKIILNKLTPILRVFNRLLRFFNTE